MEPQEALMILRDMCRGLGHVREQGYMHRDIKADNVLMFPGGRAKLADFGAAKRLYDTCTEYRWAAHASANSCRL